MLCKFKQSLQAVNANKRRKPFANAGDQYFLKYDSWPESYLLIRTIAQTICIWQTS